MMHLPTGRTLPILAILLFVPFLVRAQNMPAPGASVDYTVRADVATETFRVTAELNGISGDTIVFHFPIWGPGAYDIVNFGAFVSELTATSGGRKLEVLRGDTNTFRIVGAGGRATLAYTVHDIENVPNSLWFGLSDVEPGYTFANTPAIFGYPAGYKNIPYTVQYALPKGMDIAIGLDPAPKKRPGMAAFVARDYDELVDAPVVIGKFQRLEFKVRGVPHVIALSAPEKLSRKDAQELIDTTKRIVEIVSNFFGDMPYKRYVFQLFLATPAPGESIFGALEHRNSSTYRMPWYGSAPAEGLKGVIAHEYWHTWSPKRIRVAELGPFDYQRAPRTTSLWFAEGITEYYAKILLVRHGMIDEGELTELLDAAVRAGDVKQRMSIAELSLKIAEINPQNVLPLYTKGPLLALLLDAEIRFQTGNRKSLDDVMRYFNEQYGRTDRTFGDDDIIPVMERVTGAKLADFYRKYIGGTEPIPTVSYVERLGFKVVSVSEEMRTLGATVDAGDNGWVVSEVAPKGSAERMGLKVGDVLTAAQFGDARVSLASIPAQYANGLVSQPQLSGFSVQRGTETLSIAAKIVSGTVTTAKLEPDPAASREEVELRRSMLGF